MFMKRDDLTKGEKRKAYAFFTIIILATIIFLIVVIAMIVDSVKINSYKDIERRGLTITGQEMFSLQAGDYYIFIYSSDKSNNKIDLEKQDALEPYVANYFTFVKQNKNKKGVCEIRMMDVANKKNASCLDTTTTTEAKEWNEFKVEPAKLPALIYMVVNESNGKLTYSYDMFTKEGDIKSNLSHSISSAQEVWYIPPKKESIEA